MDSNVMCPVCTLYLRPGITLKQHLTSHPKQKVIDALVKISLHDEPSKIPSSSNSDDVSEGASTISESPSPPSNSSMPPYLNQVPLGPPSSHMAPQMPGNHFFMYQQSMSTSAPHQPNLPPLTLNPFAQQYLVPAVYNPQMMPYFYQQQQLIMSSNGIPPHIKALPFEGDPSSTSQSSSKSIEIINKDKCEEDLVEKVVELDQDGLNSQGESITSEEEENESEVNSEENQQATSEYKEETEQVVINQTSDSNYEENVYQGPSREYENHQNINEEECVDTSFSQVSNSEWNVNSDLNKACQTQTNNVLSPRPSVHSEHQQINDNTPEYYFIDQRSNVSVVLRSDNIASTFEQSQPIYNSQNILNNNEGDFMNDIEGMQVILGDFPNATLIPQDNFDSMRQQSSPPILMTIGGMNMSPKSNNDGFIHIMEPKGPEPSENCMGNVNIRSDEKMPPRGELSGQESMGSDLTWNQIQHYQDQDDPMCYEPNSWDTRSEINSYDEETDTKDVYSNDPVKEEDVKENVTKVKKDKPVALEMIKIKPKKLLIKQKRAKKEPQTSFNNVFTNKLKTENAEADGFDNIETGPSVENLKEFKTEEPDMCKQCDKMFKTKKELRAHHLEFHKVMRLKGYKCRICHEDFDMEHKFNEHLKIHPLECHICGKLFFRRQGLKLHIARHEGVKPYKCDLCDKAFLVKQKLEEHRNCHTGNAPIQCPMCPERFKRHSNLVQHRNKHHFFIKKKLKDYVCFCGEVFHSKKKFAWHNEKHDPKPKSCTQCSEKFIHTAGLTRHMRRAHNAEYLPDGRDPNSLNRVCPICKGIYLKTSMEPHMQTHLNQKAFSCTVCNKKFTTKWNLKLHKWTHAPRTQKPFKCNQCKGAFIRETDYISHMNSHKSVRPYTCNHCGAQFIRKYNCQRHVKEHENEKTYVCNVCNKSFHRSYYLKDHMRVHTGTRPYSCHICGKTSTTKSNHNKHIQIHHAREPVSTEN